MSERQDPARRDGSPGGYLDRTARGRLALLATAAGVSIYLLRLPTPAATDPA